MLFFSNCRVPGIGNQRRDDWIEAIKSQQIFEPTSFNFLVCEKHFEPSLIIRKKTEMN